MIVYPPTLHGTPDVDILQISLSCVNSSQGKNILAFDRLDLMRFSALD